MKLAILIVSAAAGTFGICELRPSGRTPFAALAALPPVSASATQRSAVALDTVTLHIEGMTCGGCTLATRTVLERLDGVTKADVSYEQKRAIVTFDPAKVTVAQLIAAVATLKYTATVLPS